MGWSCIKYWGRNRDWEKFNPFFSYFDTPKLCKANTSNGIETIGFMKYLEGVRDKTITPVNLEYVAWSISDHFMQYARELIWEEVRSKNFPSLPSRLRCIWLAVSLDDAKIWAARMKLEKNFQILKVNADGNFHIADESFLVGDSEAYSKSVENAQRYWKGELNEGGLREVLFEGNLKVIDTVSY